MNSWDVAIVGAGPAGCAAAGAALALDPHARVLLLDRSQFPRDKVCGDGIAAEAFDVLTDLGFDVARVVDGYSTVTRLRLTSPGGMCVDRTLPVPVRVIPRLVFDARLVADVVRRGAVLQRHGVHRVEMRSADVLLDDTIAARVVIGADGAESVVRRALGEPPPARWTALAIRGYAAEPAGQRETQVINMTSDGWPAYAWSFPIGDGRTNVGYGELLRPGRSLTRRDMLERLDGLFPQLGPLSDVRAHRLPLSPGRPPAGGGRLLLAGDAMSLINPLSGEGIYYAVRSGGLAGAAALNAGDEQAGYRRSLRPLSRHLRHTDVVARLIRAPRLVDAAVGAAARSQQISDDLVRLALADGRLTARLAGGLVRGGGRTSSRSARATRIDQPD